MSHILVVDDEEHLAVGIKFNLEAEGFQVTVATSGIEAINAVESAESVDLIVLDLMLPGMSGYEICEQLRESGHEMPVLMLSARTLSEDRTRGFDVGANQYMVKPFELQELISRIKNLLGQQNRRAPSLGKELDVYEFADAKINFKTYEVDIGETSVRMTQLQIKALKYFVQHEGEVISRHQLLEDVWEMPGHVTTRAPDQILRQLRKTFEPDPGKPVHFLTIRDAGYRFVKDGVE
jgi:two-component system OmpR family response regulator